MTEERKKIKEDKQKALLLIALIEDKLEKLSELNIEFVQMAIETMFDDLRLLKNGILK